MTAATASMRSRKVQRIAGCILFGIVAAEAYPFVLVLPSLMRALARPQPALAMSAGIAIGIAYILFGARGAGVRRHLGDRSWLRIPAVLVAIVAGVVEELYFRRVLMDWLQAGGVGVVLQVLASGVAFGVAHAIWGFRAGWRVALGVVSATGILGTVLAILYATDGRLIVPCIAAHVLLDLVLEPALMLNAVEAGFERRNRW